MHPFDSSWPSWLVLIALLHLLASVATGEDVTVKILKAPLPVSNSLKAEFSIDVKGCNGCRISCKLDNNQPSPCRAARNVHYSALPEGNHTFVVCANRSGELPSCANYSWTVDRVRPTATIMVSSPFTNASAVQVVISFSEPCPGRGGFTCSNADCDLLVYGAAKVLPSTLEIIQPGLRYSLKVAIAANYDYGRIILTMKKNICTDAAGNRFTRTSNSTFTLHFDKRDVIMNITAHIPTKLIQLRGLTRIVEATNNEKNLKIYLSFSEPVLNSSAEILSVCQSTSGKLVSTNRRTHGNRRFGYVVENISSLAVVTIACDSSSIISRQGTPVNPSTPFSFLYDTHRPMVQVVTSQLRTPERHIGVLIKFTKPVFNFNSSAIMVTGGQISRFHGVSTQLYNIQIQVVDEIISIAVPENTTEDVAGNKNLPSNHLQVMHYSVPLISSVASVIVIVIFALTMFVAILLTVSTSSLLSSGVFSRPVSYIISEPTRNLLRIACHIQIFALSSLLTVNLPIEYYEFSKGLQWIVPYHKLPWEAHDADMLPQYSIYPSFAYSRTNDERFDYLLSGVHPMSSMEGDPLTAFEYWTFFENMKPEAEIIMKLQSSNGWKLFGQNMFWLAILAVSFILLHGIILLILYLRKKETKTRNMGALVFPRFEIMLIIVALPCLCQASAALIRGRSTAGMIVGITFVGIITSFLAALFLFLSLGITMGKLLQYREVHQEGLEYHWYEEIIRRTLGPGKRGQWTWKDQHNTACLTKLSPLFEDLRGPPKYMLSQIAAGRSRSKQVERIIASEDENEDAEAPFMQKLFGILRVYYTFIESVKRAALGVAAGILSSSDGTSRPLVIVILALTSFQLFFIMLKKPFIKKKVQLVEIITVASETVVFATCLVVIDRDFTEIGMKRSGLAMLAVFFFAFAAQMINEWYALYKQVVLLGPASESFSQGLKEACRGLLWIVILPKNPGEADQQAATPISNGRSGNVASLTDPAQRDWDTSERSWLRQLREMAKASFAKENAPGDPSSSTFRMWGGKRSRSSSVTSSADYKARAEQKARPKGLYKDLEAIFSQ